MPRWELSVRCSKRKTGQRTCVGHFLPESAMAMFAPMIVGGACLRTNVRAGKEHLSGGLPYYNTFCCSDGRWIAVGAVEQKFQQKIKDVVGTTKYERSKRVLLRHTQEECVELLSEAGVSPIVDILELPKQQQHQFRQHIPSKYSSKSIGWITD